VVDSVTGETPDQASIPGSGGSGGLRDDLTAGGAGTDGVLYASLIIP
jgi:hypothetical protein